MNNKQAKTLVNSYRELFQLTGKPEFFTLYRFMERTNIPVLLPEQTLAKEREEELTL